jgi:hypothetical protein
MHITTPDSSLPRNHKQTLVQEMDLFLPTHLSAHIPFFSNDTYLQPIMSWIGVEFLPRCITLTVQHQHCPNSSYFFLLQSSHTLNLTTKPVSQMLSRLTLVRFSGVFSGFPPFGAPKMRSGCCAYKARKARVRSPFWSGVTSGRNLKHAIRVTGVSVVAYGEAIVRGVRGASGEKE